MAKKAATKKETSSKVKVEILAYNMAGKYGLPYNPGHKVELEAKMAEEIIDAGDGKKA